MRNLLSSAPLAASDTYEVNQDTTLQVPVRSTSAADLAAAWNGSIELSNPLHWWRFDEAQGTRAIDYGTAKVDGHYVGGVVLGASGLVGGAARFDGTGMVRVGARNLVGSWTMESIFLVDASIGVDSQGLLASGAEGQPEVMAVKSEQFNDTGRIGYTRFGVRDVVFDAPSPSTLTHVVMVGTPDGVSLFVDGHFIGTDSLAISLGRFAIGVTQVDSGSPRRDEAMVGMIDEMILYDRALSAEEISLHHRAITLSSANITDALLGVLNNDVDADGDTLTAVIDGEPAHGSLRLLDAGIFSYTPDPGFSGLDQFRYRASDGVLLSESSTVQIRVIPEPEPPRGRDDRYVLNEDGYVTAAAFGGVLTNDIDYSEPNPLTAVLVKGPSFGTLQLAPDGSFAYAAGASFGLIDHFIYRAIDGKKQSADVVVTIQKNVPTIKVGNHQLLPNTPGQRIFIKVEGGQFVGGVDLYAQIGDGGPERSQLGLPPGTDGPAIESVDLNSLTIFFQLSERGVNIGSLPQVANWTLSLAEGNVPADGLLATLVVDTTGFFDGTWDLRLSEVLPDFPGGPLNTEFANSPILIENGQITIAPARVVGRHVFYNHSAYDGDETSANGFDDSAIATDKLPLLPGQKASFANYTSYAAGINGLMLDIQGLPRDTSITAGDFEFLVGRSNDLTSWSAAPPPSHVAIRRNQGEHDSDRVTVIWPDQAITNQWLRVRLRANARLWLRQDDVFYFGNAPGETGTVPINAFVTAIDVIGARDNQRGPFDRVDVTNAYDFNRDRLVTSSDVIIARDHPTGVFNSLPLITAPFLSVAATPAQHLQNSTVGSDNDTSPSICGDVNHDGHFDTDDLVFVFQRGWYETVIQANAITWEDGDWNGDHRFDYDDLLCAIAAARFE